MKMFLVIFSIFVLFLTETVDARGGRGGGKTVYKPGNYSKQINRRNLRNRKFFFYEETEIFLNAEKEYPVGFPTARGTKKFPEPKKHFGFEKPWYSVFRYEIENKKWAVISPSYASFNECARRTAWFAFEKRGFRSTFHPHDIFAVCAHVDEYGEKLKNVWVAAEYRIFADMVEVCIRCE